MDMLAEINPKTSGSGWHYTSRRCKQGAGKVPHMAHPEDAPATALES